MNVVIKLVGAVVSLGAGLAGGKIVDFVWTKATGHKPPKPGDTQAQAQASLRQALGFAVASAVVAAVIQVFTSRGTERALVALKQAADEV